MSPAFRETPAFAQLAHDVARSRLALPHAAPVRGLYAPLRTLRRATLETMLRRAEQQPRISDDEA